MKLVFQDQVIFLFAEKDAMEPVPFGHDGRHEILANENEFLQMMMPVISIRQGCCRPMAFFPDR